MIQAIKRQAHGVCLFAIVQSQADLQKSVANACIHEHFSGSGLTKER